MVFKMYEIVCTAMVRRTYQVFAANKDEAEDIISDAADDEYLVEEETISEDIDGVKLAKKQP